MKAILLKPMDFVQTCKGPHGFTSRKDKKIYRLLIPDENLVVTWSESDSLILCRREKQLHWRNNEIGRELVLNRVFLERLQDYRTAHNAFLEKAQNLEVEAALFAL